MLVLIPAYNEEQNIVSVVEDLQQHCPQYDYILSMTEVRTRRWIFAGSVITEFWISR